MSLADNKIALEALRDKANALPDAGSGGATLEACTVTFSTNYSNYIADMVTGVKVIDGTPCGFFDENPSMSTTIPLTITDVLCGSYLLIHLKGTADATGGGDTIITQGCELVYFGNYHTLFYITAVDGESVYIYNDKTAMSEPD